MQDTTATQVPSASTRPLNSIEIEVTGFKPYLRNTLHGWIDLTLPDIGLKIAGIALHERDGERWLSLPSREFESNGERKFAPIIEFTSKESRNAFQRAALNALDAFRKGGDL